jgi:hypothetical protein
MIFWKPLAAIDLAILLGYGWALLRRDEEFRRADAISVPASLIGTTSLFVYAFELRVFSPLIWRVLLPLFVGASAFELVSAGKKPDANTGTLIGMAIAGLIVAFSTVAMYRLGGAHWIGF